MEISGQRGDDPWIPHLLGHEASGVVIDTHSNASKFKKGDEVILTWIEGSGKKASQITFNRGDEAINAGSVTTFSNYSVVSENRAVMKPADLSFKEAILFGCALPTGAGIIMNEIQPKKEDSILIIGLGGIGLAAMIMCLAMGIKNVAVVDQNEEKLSYAKKLGIKFRYDSKKITFNKEINRDYPSGFDFCVECAGHTKTIEMGFSLLNKNGALHFASHPPEEDLIRIRPHDLISGKKIFGSWGGSTFPDRDIPKMWNYIKESQIDLSDLIPRVYNLDKINMAIQDLKEGKVFRPIIEMPHK
jgi:S-(hydroxymethyl)glutathione dehydrogenase/alcohol dehydrogenase